MHISQENRDLLQEVMQPPSCVMDFTEQGGVAKVEESGNLFSSLDATTWLRVQGEMQGLEKAEGSLCTELLATKS